jgi:hypothetical protein
LLHVSLSACNTVDGNKLKIHCLPSCPFVGYSVIRGVDYVVEFM